ncbi:phosphoribosylaminoimidazole-succinocarboxamide synthase [Fusarium albosuccineum]|uniref:Phosphoribosylaminoimidazole-succinocarboxamide synthase n=1 Tax=Fusarium albosuccineum TaxID=1237068 RepID=A0A8H4PFS9_9HYPO|nr:phosphoribosylaminoimidazole-succinocarboxamide synthase [Fusarium albosuccineum]
MASTSSGYVSYGRTACWGSTATAVDKGDVQDAELPPLDFRPTILTGGALFLSLVFHLLVLGTLVFLYYKEIFSVSYAWAYFVIKILPTVIGTATAVLVDEMGQSLSRIRPFMLCAQEGGFTADKTILMSYFPMPDFTTLWKSRNWLLLVSKALSFINYFTIGLKTSFLLTPDYQNAELVPWAVLSLVGLYAVVSLYLIAVFFSLHGKVTGLRWDPVSMADQLVLFRRSDFLDMFEGTSLANRAAIENHLGDLRLRIGYWEMGSGYWHGFGLVGPSQTQHRARQGAAHDTVPGLSTSSGKDTEG